MVMYNVSVSYRILRWRGGGGGGGGGGGDKLQMIVKKIVAGTKALPK